MHGRSAREEKSHGRKNIDTAVVKCDGWHLISRRFSCLFFFFRSTHARTWAVSYAREQVQSNTWTRLTNITGRNPVLAGGWDHPRLDNNPSGTISGPTTFLLYTGGYEVYPLVRAWYPRKGLWSYSTSRSTTPYLSVLSKKGMSDIHNRQIVSFMWISECLHVYVREVGSVPTIFGQLQGHNDHDQNTPIPRP